MSEGLKLVRVVSGGQTGADQAALRAAKALGFQTGGWVPRGCLTEGGPAPWLVTEFGCRESASAGYPARTRLNVAESDATLIFSRCWEPGHPTGTGSLLTKQTCVALGKLHLVADPFDGCEPLDAAAEGIRQWLTRYQVRTLNVAGSRESKAPGIGARVEAILREVLG
jgi:hypothetical protein